MTEDKEDKGLSWEQRKALDAVRHACKDGTISNASLYDLLCNLKNILKLKNKEDHLKVTIPSGIDTILELSEGDRLSWEPILILNERCAIVTKSKLDRQKEKNVSHD